MGWKNKYRKAVTFSYDDGVTQDIRMIELLNKYGLKATFNLNSELLSKPGMLTYQGVRASHYKVAPECVREIYAGHEVAAHTLTHLRLPELDDAEVIRQVEKDRQNLSSLVGYEVIGMAYPCGGVNNDDRVAALIRENTGIKYARTITSVDSFDLQDNLYRFNPSVYHLEWDKMPEMAETFLKLEPETPQLFYIWGHSYEFDRADTWGQFEAFLQIISGREDIFYGTNREGFGI